VSELERMREVCRHCGGGMGRKVAYRYRNGVVHVRHECSRCATLSLYCLPKSSATSDLPLVRDRLGEGSPCARCGRRGTELHHWAPRKHFGDEADLWPVDWLCRDCHRRWHVETGIAVGYRGTTANNICATGSTPEGSYTAPAARLSRRSRLGEDGYALWLLRWLAGGCITESELRFRLRLHEAVRRS
jgi:hypothetical protein